MQTQNWHVLFTLVDASNMREEYNLITETFCIYCML